MWSRWFTGPAETSTLQCSRSCSIRGRGGKQPLRFATAALRNPRTLLRASNPRHWSRRTLLFIVMQSLDSSIRLRPWRRLRDGTVLLQTEPDPGSPRPQPIPAAYDVARRLAERMGGTAQAWR